MYLDWVGMLFGLVGTYMLTLDHKGKLIGWGLLVVASIAFGLFGYSVGSNAMVLSQTSYLLLELYAFAQQYKKGE